MASRLRRFSSFSYLNATQFLVTLNDSIFRLIVAYSLIAILGEGQANRILAISATLFVMPFLLFAMPAGQLADRFSKKRVIMWTLWAELIFMFLGIFAISIKHEFMAYFALFLIALQSAIFNPSKYSILPEIESPERLSRVNGIMTLTSYLSIILGTFLASFVSDITGRNFVFVIFLCIIFSIVALFTGKGIEKTPVQNPNRKINPWFVIDIYKNLKISSNYPHLLLSMFAAAYFLFTAAYTQLNLIPFGVQSLGITEIQTGYVYLAAALGIGVGALIVGTVSGKTIELGLSIWGAFGTAASYLLLYFFQYNLLISCFIFFSIGFHGGLFVVPMDAYMQYASPKEGRGSIIAAATFISFIGVLISAGTLALFGNVLELRAATGFLIIGMMTTAFAVWILFALPNYATRLFAVLSARFFFTINVTKLPERGILVCDRKSLINSFSLISSFQKIRFLKWSKNDPSRMRVGFAKIFNTLPYNLNSLKQIQKTVDDGYILCLFSDTPGVIQESANSEDGVTDFTQALEVREAGSVNHRSDTAGLKDGDSITGRSRLLNHERYKTLDVLINRIETPFYRVIVDQKKNHEGATFHFLRVLQPKLDIYFEELK